MKRFILIILVFISTIGNCQVFENNIAKLSKPLQLSIAVSTPLLTYNSLTQGERYIQQDKYLHYWGTFAITINTMQINPILGLSVGFGVGLAKELYDLNKYGYFNYADMYANLTAILTACVVYTMQHYEIIYK